ncbi:hypothetical protein G6F57_023319 [Rhizopus arrhizus]|nr:hypothetical protein G6F57_023319 [Rhizopus arrhizus]
MDHAERGGDDREEQHRKAGDGGDGGKRLRQPCAAIDREGDHDKPGPAQLEPGGLGNARSVRRGRGGIRFGSASRRRARNDGGGEEGGE